MQFKQTFLLFTLSLIPFLAFGVDSFPPLEEILRHTPEEVRSAIQTEGEKTVFHDGEIVPETLPAIEFTKEIRDRMIEGGLTLGMEGLYLLSDLPEGYKSKPEDEKLLILYNILRSISTLEGLEYYSYTAKKMKLLFEESWVMEKGNPRNKLEDPLTDSLIPRDLIYIHQKDNRFGKNQYTMSYRNEEQNMSASINNLSQLKVSGLFRVVEKEKMQIHICVLPVQEGILVYVTMAAATDTNSFRERAQQSFANRATALKVWFESRVREEFN